MARDARRPLVSVVMPAHNVAPYLPAALSSVAGQSLEDFEVVCVDDCSTDDTSALLDGFRERDPRFTVHRLLQQSGPGRARNVGIARARGQFLAFADADDVVPPDALLRMWQTLDHSGSDLVAGRVLRFSATRTWPSELHERAIRRPQLRTHITATPSLLHDTTSWNKLYRRDFWDRAGLRFPEGVLYEDGPVMVEAHCRARSVDLISDVVYHWRLREGGPRSITQSRLDLVNLDHRLASFRSIRSVLESLGLDGVQQAFQSRVLRHDMTFLLRQSLRVTQADRERWIGLLRDHLEEWPPSALADLPPQLRVDYHVLRTRSTGEVVALLEHEEAHGWVLPLKRRNLGLDLDLGPARGSAPSSLTRTPRRILPRTGVRAVGGEEDHLVLEGYAFVPAVPFGAPWAQSRVLKLSERGGGGRTQSTLVMPRRDLQVTAAHGVPQVSYGWSGFRVRLPLQRLAPPAGAPAAHWTVQMRVATPFGGGERRLGPPMTGQARFPPPVRTSDGLICAVGWGRNDRLRLTVRRQVGVVTALGESAQDGSVTMRLRLASVARKARKLVLWSGRRGVCREAPLRRAGHGHEREAVLRLTADDLDELLGTKPSLDLRIGVVLPGQGRLWLDAPEKPLVLAVGDRMLTVHSGRAGRATLAVASSGTWVTGVTWEGDVLNVMGVCTKAGGDLPGLEWQLSSGERLVGVEERHGNRFLSVFEPWAVPGPDGPRALAAGQWVLHGGQPGAARASRPQVVRGREGAVEGARPRRSRAADDTRVYVDRHGHVVMRVHAVPLHDRGVFAQDAIRRGPYRAAQRSPLRDAVLFESWQGKQYSDNPRALVEEALRRDGSQELIVAVRDHSLAVPEGVRRVVRWSRDYYEALATSRTIVANDSMTPHFVKRAGQRYLQTWHGTPLKRIGFDIETIRFRNRNYLDELADEVRRWDWLVSPNPDSTRLLRRAFRFEGEMVECGYPRNDLLVRPEADEVRARTRRWLGLGPDTVAVLWAPTWRDEQFLEAGGYLLPLTLDLGAMAKSLGATHRLLFRGHHLMGGGMRLDGPGGDFVQDVSSYPDVRHLYCAADVLVTDYSSAMFDFALTGRPIVHYVWDLEAYKATRGHYFDLHEIAGGPLVEDQAGLEAAVADPSASAAANRERRRALVERFGAWDDGKAAARIWDLLDGS